VDIYDPESYHSQEFTYALSLFYKNARSALYDGLRKKGYQKGDNVLCPHFICKEAIAAFRMLEINLVYYNVEGDLRVDWGDVDSKINENQNGPIRGFFLVHYFGQYSSLDDAIAFTERYAIDLIEDNAHGYGGFCRGIQLGRFGDIGISSPRKMIGINNGAELYLEGRPQVIDNASKGDLFYAPSFYTIAKYLTRKWVLYRAFSYNLFWRKKMPKLTTECVGAYEADSLSTYIIKHHDWKLEASSRRDYWDYWKSVIELFGGEVPLDIFPDSSPWAIPARFFDNQTRGAFVDMMKKKGMRIFFWPSLDADTLAYRQTQQIGFDELLCINLIQGTLRV